MKAYILLFVVCLGMTSVSFGQGTTSAAKGGSLGTDGKSLINIEQTLPDTTGAKADTTKSKATVAKPRIVKPIPKPVVKKPKLLSKEFSGGVRMNTDGWGIFVDKGTVKSDMTESDLFYHLKYWEIELDEKKNLKEKKAASTFTNYDNKQKKFIYGKVNNFYTLKFGYGFRKMIAGKPEIGTVSIHWIYSGGLSLGLLKPYYVNVYGGDAIKYTDSTQSQFLDQGNLTGAAGFAKGLGETKIIPGLHAKTGLHFDFSTSKKTILAVETGVNAELYTKNIMLMANQKAVPYFLDAYVSLAFGKRW